MKDENTDSCETKVDEVSPDLRAFELSIEVEDVRKKLDGLTSEMKSSFAKELQEFVRTSRAAGLALEHSTYSAAVQLYERALAKSVVALEAADFLLAKSEMEKAKETADSIVAEDACPNVYRVAEEARQQAISLAASKDYKMAVELVCKATEQFLRLRMEMPTVKLKSAEEARLDGRLLQCISFVEDVLEKDPGNADALALKDKVFSSFAVERDCALGAISEDVIALDRLMSIFYFAEDALKSEQENANARALKDVVLASLSSARKHLPNAKDRRPGEEMVMVLSNGTPMLFCWCPATTSDAWMRISGGKDCFLMGSPDYEDDRRDDEFLHHVILTMGFWIGKYPVTRRQWHTIMNKEFRGVNPDLPMREVSKIECELFIDRVNGGPKGAISLPTEAQWEYACRAGTTTPFSFGLSLDADKANYDSIGDKGGKGMPTPVGSYPANAWGIHDMHGNVREWCADMYGGYFDNVTDPDGPRIKYNLDPHCGVLRGGHYGSLAKNCRSAQRFYADVRYNLPSFGVRLVCNER